MAFDWMQVTSRPPQRPGAHDAVFRAEILERARLLRGLGFSQADALTRIDAAARWEYTDPDFLGEPAFLAEIEGLVAGVFGGS